MKNLVFIFIVNLPCIFLNAFPLTIDRVVLEVSKRPYTQRQVEGLCISNSIILGESPRRLDANSWLDCLQSGRDVLLFRAEADAQKGYGPSQDLVERWRKELSEKLPPLLASRDIDRRHLFNWIEASLTARRFRNENPDFVKKDKVIQELEKTYQFRYFKNSLVYVELAK